MDIRIKEALYVSTKEGSYVVRQNTLGVEKKGVIFFHDSTKTASVGFDKNFCIENPQTFNVSRTLSDKEVSVRDVIKVLELALGIDPHELENIKEQIKAL